MTSSKWPRLLVDSGMKLDRAALPEQADECFSAANRICDRRPETPEENEASQKNAEMILDLIETQKKIQAAIARYSAEGKVHITASYKRALKENINELCKLRAGQ